MIEKNESKTLYDEIFNANKAPEVIDNNGNQEIKDALKMEKFDNKELIDLEDIFVFEDQEKNNDSSSNDNSLELVTVVISVRAPCIPSLNEGFSLSLSRLYHIFGPFGSENGSVHKLLTYKWRVCTCKRVEKRVK